MSVNYYNLFDKKKYDKSYNFMHLMSIIMKWYVQNLSTVKGMSFLIVVIFLLEVRNNNLKTVVQ